jgi:hypothetical protein
VREDDCQIDVKGEYQGLTFERARSRLEVEDG